MPEWVFTDMQERLNAAQQLLDNRGMPCNQGHLGGIWPRASPRSPACKGESCIDLLPCTSYDCLTAVLGAINSTILDKP